MTTIVFVGTLTAASYMIAGWFSADWVTDVIEARDRGQPTPRVPAELWHIWSICAALSAITVMAAA
ncbi:hypothetical protein [Pseudooceanicola sp.]|uniref:hypothetical protein n=1 Tax=Pseudooceanicola sp. TaxID=1914328 RepID=UPI00351126E3